MPTTRTRHLGPQFAPAFDRPFLRYFDGENGAPGGTPPAAPAEQTPPAAPAAPAPVPTPPPAQPAAPATPPAQPEPVNYRGNPDEYVRELRGEARTHREAFEKEQGEHTATKAERDAAIAERDTLQRERAVLLAAPRLGAAADLLLDSSSFTKTLADIDLTDQAAVDKAITDALERNSAFRAGPTLPGASGPGHQGSQRTTTPTKSLEGAVAAHFGG
ncbi:hypothetical protein B0I12_002551 [Microbacterium hydrothermale]|uniref:hypothetical protein n=1 Tax=Microbacterium hydrothermale TaxID=857427 RepID=UPI002225C556|nr:hypothetical protein [Microbacterium hydrothermale]MCW2165396.1 hypothetical protein [Microbacterium hydrothermale]